MFVIFEGLDKAGKTTLEWEFLKATNFKHIVIDRGPAGYMVFDELFKRRTLEGDTNFIKAADFAMQSNKFIVVYCKVAYDVAMQRLKEHNEECPYNYESAQKSYDLHVDIAYRDKEKVVVIDTTKSIEECVNMIVQKLEEVLKSEHN